MPTVIGEVTYLLNYVIIRVSFGKPFPLLLGRPWLYTAGVLVDWRAWEFVLGKTRQRIPWKSDRYTTDWSDPEEGEEALDYFVGPFGARTETDFEFPLPVWELSQPEEIRVESTEAPEIGPEDRSLGESNTPLSARLIREQLADGKLPPVGLSGEDTDLR
jgi:hypothetical protein